MAKVGKPIDENTIIKDGTIDAIINDFKNLNSTIDKTDQSFKSFAKSVKEFKFPKGSGEFKQLIADTKELESVFKSQITTQREKIKIQQEEERLNKLKLQTENQQIKNNQQITKQVKEQTPEWQKLLDRKRQLTAQIKEEVLINGQLSPKLKALRSEYAGVKGTIDGVNESLGNHQHKVGQYENAISGLKGALGQLGLAFGGFALAREAFNVISETNELSADMAKTLNITTEEAQKLTLEFTKLKSSTPIAELQKIATIGGQFGLDSSEITGFVESMDKLNIALGSDFGGVENASQQLGALRNAFTDIKTTEIDKDLLGIGNALNELSTKGAKVEVVTEFSNRISGLATNLGVTAGEILGLSATLAKLNVNVERGGTAVGTIFQRMTQDAEGFAKVAGVSTEEFTALLNTDMVGAFKLVAKSFEGFRGDNVKIAKTLESLKLTGSGASEVFLKMASNTELLDANVKTATESLKAQDSILQEVAKKSTTVGASLQKVKNALTSFVLEANQGTGAQNGIIVFFDFLSRNLPTIISLVAKLATTWLTYKAIMLGMDFGKRAKEFLQFSKAVVTGEKSMKDAGESAKKFGSALKGIGIGLAIAVFLEIGKALWDIANGASQAREDLARLDKQLDISNKTATGKVAEIQEKMNQRLAEYNKLLKEGQITQKQYNILVAQSGKEGEKEIKNNKILANDRKERYKDLLAETKALKLKQDANTIEVEEITRLREIGEELGITLGEVTSFRGEVAGVEDIISTLNANISGTNERIVIYSKAIKEGEDATKDFTDQTAETSKEVSKSKDIFIDYTKSIRDLNTEMIEGSDDLMTDYLRNVEKNQNELQDALEKVAQDRKKLEEDARNSRITDGKERTILNAKIIKEEQYIHTLRLSHQKEQQELWDAYISQRVDDLKERFAQEKQLQKEALEEQQKFYDYKVETGGLTDRVNELQLYNAEYNRILNDQTLSEEKKNKKIEDLNLQHQKRMLEIQIKYVRQQIEIQSTMANRFKDELGETSEEYENARKRMLELEEQLQNLLTQQAQNVEKKSGLKGALKKVADYFSGLISAIGDKMNEMFDNMVKSQNRVIENSQKMIDYLKQAAIQGNLQASQSILAEEKKIEESQRRIEKIEKNRQRVQFITSILGSYSQKVASGDKNALLSTLSESAVLSALLRALPSFDVGADRLSNSGQNIDGKGGMFAINHPDERILTAGQNKQIGFDYKNNEIVNVMKAFNSGVLIPVTKMPVALQNNGNYEPILREIKDGFSQINNYNISVTELFGMIEVMITKSKGNSKVTDFKKYRS